MSGTHNTDLAGVLGETGATDSHDDGLPEETLGFTSHASPDEDTSDGEEGEREVQLDDAQGCRSRKTLTVSTPKIRRRRIRI